MSKGTGGQGSIISGLCSAYAWESCLGFSGTILIGSTELSLCSASHKKYAVKSTCEIRPKQRHCGCYHLPHALSRNFVRHSPILHSFFSYRREYRQSPNNFSNHFSGRDTGDKTTTGKPKIIKGIREKAQLPDFVTPILSSHGSHAPARLGNERIMITDSGHGQVKGSRTLRTCHNPRNDTRPEELEKHIFGRNNNRVKCGQNRGHSE